MWVKPTKRLPVGLIANPRWFTDQFAASDEATGSISTVCSSVQRARCAASSRSLGALGAWDANVDVSRTDTAVDTPGVARHGRIGQTSTSSHHHKQHVWWTLSDSGWWWSARSRSWQAGPGWSIAGLVPAGMEVGRSMRVCLAWYEHLGGACLTRTETLAHGPANDANDEHRRLADSQAGGHRATCRRPRAAYPEQPKPLARGRPPTTATQRSFRCTQSGGLDHHCRGSAIRVCDGALGLLVRPHLTSSACALCAFFSLH